MATTAETTNQTEEGVFKLAPFNPSSQQIQEKAFHLLQLKDDDVLFDLGCGDGRLLVAAAKLRPGIRCVGVEIDPVFATRAAESVKSHNLQSRIDIRVEDALKVSMIPKIATSTSTDENNNDNNNNDDDDDETNGISATAMTTGTFPQSDSINELTLVDDASALYLFVLPKGIAKLMPLLNAIVQIRQEQKRKFRVLSYMFKIHDWEPTIVDKTSKGGCPVYLYEF